MRKINSEYKTAFVSEAGSELINNDYFGYVELEDFACYVVADGLYKGVDAESAKLAIKAVVQKFMERPSIRKRAIKNYLRAANKVLVLSSDKKRQRLRTSITVVVTNYEAMRYASVGNTRMYLYRGDQIFARSTDTSLAQRMVEREGSSSDKLARHRERNNLSTYLGQKNGFSPYISKKIPLKESDVITLFTRGIWENVEDGEMIDVFSETGDNPREAVDLVEELLLSRQPSELENYTFAAIYVNKVFQDPNRKKRIKKIIIISVIVAVVLIVIALVLFFWLRHRQQLRTDMEDHLTRVVMHIEHNNFPGALAEVQGAEDLARRLRNQDALRQIDTYLQLIEAVILGDTRLDEGRFQEAQDAFLRGQGYAVLMDRLGYDDIGRRLEITENFINFFSLMELGDSLVALGNYEMALTIFNEARVQASSLFFSAGRQQALDAIADVHVLMIREDEREAAAAGAVQAEREAEAAERAAVIAAAAELIAQGDREFAAGDYIAARAFFQMAREMYLDIGDQTAAATAAARIALAESRLANREEQEEAALEFAALGDWHFNNGNFRAAQRYYTLARQIFADLNIVWRVTQMDNQLELVRQALEQDQWGPPWGRAA